MSHDWIGHQTRCATQFSYLDYVWLKPLQAILPLKRSKQCSWDVFQRFSFQQPVCIDLCQWSHSFHLLLRWAAFLPTPRRRVVLCCCCSASSACKAAAAAGEFNRLTATWTLDLTAVFFFHNVKKYIFPGHLNVCILAFCSLYLVGRLLSAHRPSVHPSYRETATPHTHTNRTWRTTYSTRPVWDHCTWIASRLPCITISLWPVLVEGLGNKQ